MASIRVGFIGTGRISTLHRLQYESDERAELVAVCDKNKKLVKQQAADWGIKEESAHTNIEEFLARDDIDAVEVLTPHSQHADQVVAACEAGKHVSVQKVPCLTLGEFDRMQGAARKAGVKLKVFENFQFHAPYVRALELIADGVIGKVMAANIRMWSAVEPLSAWDVPLKTWRWRITERENYKLPTLFDDGYHKHNMIHLFLGKEVYAVQAWRKAFRLFGVLPVELPAVVSYKCKGHEYGTWNVSMAQKLPIRSNYYGCDEAVEIQGERGIIWINGCTGNLFLPESCGIGNAGVHWIDSAGTWHSDCTMKTDWKHSFMECTRDFIGAILDDREPYRSGKEARHVLQVALAMVTSLRSGFRDVRVKSITDGLPASVAEPEEHVSE